MKEKHLILSRVQTPDGTILISKYVHDYVGHTDKNGEYYFLDGGNEYQRKSINKEPAKDLSIWSDSPFEIIRQNCLRGTFDEKGNRIWKPISELSNAHLENILDYNERYGYTNSLQHKYILKELEYRSLNKIFITDNWNGQKI